MLQKCKKAIAWVDAMPRRWFWVAVAAFTLARCAFASLQMVYIWIYTAPLDDELMFYLAQSITRGEWLGPYNHLTLSKHMFFPVWLAGLHALHIPYLVGGAALWCLAALAAARAFAPLLGTRGRQLLLYVALAFLPSSWAAYTLRVYRDNIFPALCLLFFAGWAGAALRAIGARKAPLWPWLLLAGVGLACGYLNREDAGLFLLPFAAVGTVILLAVLLPRRRWAGAAALALPYAVLAAGITVFCALNYTWYGYWGVSDFAGGAFSDAMGAMMRVDTDNEDIMLSVPADARARIYQVAPELQCLYPWIEENSSLRGGYYDKDREDYRAGAFYWIVRAAAYYEGIYDTQQTAEAYWTAVAQHINAACEDGTLPARTGRRSSTAQPVTARYVLPTLQETARSLLWVVAMMDCAPYELQLSYASAEEMATWTGYLSGTPLNYAAVEGTDTPYYSPLQRLVFGAAELWRYPYAALLALGLLWALVRQFRALPAVLRARRATVCVPWLLLFGLLGMALLRSAMIAFVEVSSFGIGTYTMYLATVHPLLVLYAVCGTAGQPQTE